MKLDEDLTGRENMFGKHKENWKKKEYKSWTKSLKIELEDIHRVRNTRLKKGRVVFFKWVGKMKKVLRKRKKHEKWIKERNKKKMGVRTGKQRKARGEKKLFTQRTKITSKRK